MVLRGVRGGYHSRGGGSRGAGRTSYHGGSGYHGSNHHNSSSYDNRNDNRNSRYSSSGGGGGGGGSGGGGGGGGYDSRNSSRYESDSRYSRHDSRNDNYKRSNSSKYEDNRDRRSPDRKRPRSDHNTQGGSSRRDYGSSGSGAVGGRGGGSSSRYHEGGSTSSSYDKRGSNEHHSSSSGAADSSSRSKFDHHRSSSSASRSHGGGGGSGGGGGGGGDSSSSYRSRDNSSSMGPPRSVAMRSNHSSSSGGGRSMMRPPMGGGHRSHIGGSSLMGSGGMHRRGGGIMRGRISHYRSDGRRGMLTSRIMGGHHRRTDMRPMTMHNRRYPSIRGRGDMRSRIMGGSDVMSKRTLDMKMSKKMLYKRALQAAKDGYDESPSENDDDDDEDDGDVGAAPSRSKKAKKSDASVAEDDEEEEEADIKEEKSELWDDEDDAGDTKSKSSARNEEDHDEDEANKTGTTVGEEEEAKEKDSAKQQTTTKKTIKKEDAKDSAEGDRKASDEGSENKRSTKINTKYRSSNFIKLTCVHCKIKCVTFKEYQTHLYTRSHKLKMRALAVKCRERLLEMRAAQRNAQKDEDEKSDDGTGGEESKRPGFCMLCRLNYRQQRAIHQQSEGHKMMKKFLMPYCNICNLGFKSPMAFETHRASLDHLKIKARVERYASSTKGDESGEENPPDTGDIDLNSLTIVDEVGKVDEICDPGVGAETAPARKRGFGGDGGGRAGTEDDDDEDDDDEDEDDENQMIIGEEYVKKVQVQYCELCNMYLPRRAENQERVLREHCKKRSHLKLYIRFRKDKKLREQAERIHKKKLKGDKEAATGTKGDDKKINDSAGTTESKPSTDNISAASTNPTDSASIKSESDIKPEKKHDSSIGSDSTATNTTTKPNASSTGSANTVSQDPASVDSSEANLSLDGSNNLTAISSADGPGTLTDEQVDKLMWQVVDNDDLGDLLRDVQDDVEEEDDDKTNLERYDKFRHTEKNGLEQQRSDAPGDGVADEEDSVSSKPPSGTGKKGTAANGAADVAANGETGKEAKPVVG